MEIALNILSNHPTVTKIGAQMRAERVQTNKLSGFGSENHHALFGNSEGSRLAFSNVLAGANRIPAAGEDLRIIEYSMLGMGLGSQVLLSGDPIFWPMLRFDFSLKSHLAVLLVGFRSAPE